METKREIAEMKLSLEPQSYRNILPYKVIMVSPDGIRGYVPSNQIEQAMKEGYRLE